MNPQLDSRSNVAGRTQCRNRAFGQRILGLDERGEGEGGGGEEAREKNEARGLCCWATRVEVGAFFAIHSYFLSSLSCIFGARCPPYWFVACAKVTPFFTLTAQVNSLNLSSLLVPKFHLKLLYLRNEQKKMERGKGGVRIGIRVYSTTFATPGHQIGAN